MTCTQYQKKAHQINQQPVIHYKTCNQKPKPKSVFKCKKPLKETHLIIFKIPAFYLFVITCWEQIRMSSAHCKTCLYTTLTLINIVTDSRVQNAHSLLPVNSSPDITGRSFLLMLVGRHTSNLLNMTSQCQLQLPSTTIPDLKISKHVQM
jgi:hypothetical protein